MGDCAGVILAVPVSFIACWVLFAVLFDLDLTESRLCAAIYWTVGALVGVPILFSSLWLWDLLW